MDKHQLTQNIRNFLMGQRKMDLVGFCPAEALAEEPAGRRPTDLLGQCRSVIVFGRLEEVEDHDRAIEITRALCHKFTSDEEYIEKEIENAGARTMVVCLTPEHMTGKTVLES